MLDWVHTRADRQSGPLPAVEDALQQHRSRIPSVPARRRVLGHAERRASPLPQDLQQPRLRSHAGQEDAAVHLDRRRLQSEYERVCGRPHDLQPQAPGRVYGPLIATEFGSFDCSSPHVSTLLTFMRKFDIWPSNSGGPEGLGSCGYRP